jgi:hypothetical protein
LSATDTDATSIISFNPQEVRPGVAAIAATVDLKASDGLPESSSSDDSSSSSSSSEDEEDAASSVSEAAHSRSSMAEAVARPASAERLAAREARCVDGDRSTRKKAATATLVLTRGISFFSFYARRNQRSDSTSSDRKRSPVKSKKRKMCQASGSPPHFFPGLFFPPSLTPRPSSFATVRGVPPQVPNLLRVSCARRKAAAALGRGRAPLDPCVSQIEKRVGRVPNPSLTVSRN